MVDHRAAGRLVGNGTHPGVSALQAHGHALLLATVHGVEDGCGGHADLAGDLRHHVVGAGHFRLHIHQGRVRDFRTHGRDEEDGHLIGHRSAHAVVLVLQADGAVGVLDARGAAGQVAVHGVELDHDAAVVVEDDLEGLRRSRAVAAVGHLQPGDDETAVGHVRQVLHRSRGRGGVEVVPETRDEVVGRARGGQAGVAQAAAAGTKREEAVGTHEHLGLVLQVEGEGEAQVEGPLEAVVRQGQGRAALADVDPVVGWPFLVAGVVPHIAVAIGPATGLALGPIPRVTVGGVGLAGREQGAHGVGVDHLVLGAVGQIVRETQAGGGAGQLAVAVHLILDEGPAALGKEAFPLGQSLLLAQALGHEALHALVPVPGQGHAQPLRQ